MKNIHVLPTPNPSKLHLAFNKTFILSVEPTNENELYQSVPKNLYITSDEEIKEGDWFLGLQNQISKATSKDIYGGYELKIILTDNTDLIKDGIQPINDEFLEWFVKNQNCENIDIDAHVHSTENGHILHYKIIIPKEEKDYTALLQPIGTKEEFKQENCCTPIGQIKRYVNCVGCDKKPKQDKIMERFIANAKQESFNSKRGLKEVQIKDPNDCEYYEEAGCLKDVCDCYTLVPKQETTLEEAYLNKLIDEANKEFTLDRKLAKEVAIKFAKFQQEQDKNKYSEEEVMNILKERDLHNSINMGGNNTWIDRPEWFEKFKKK